MKCQVPTEHPEKNSWRDAKQTAANAETELKAQGGLVLEHH
jgi:hypothetical protein